MVTQNLSYDSQVIHAGYSVCLSSISAGDTINIQNLKASGLHTRLIHRTAVML